MPPPSCAIALAFDEGATPNTINPILKSSGAHVNFRSRCYVLIGLALRRICALRDRRPALSRERL